MALQNILRAPPRRAVTVRRPAAKRRINSKVKEDFSRSYIKIRLFESPHCASLICALAELALFHFEPLQAQRASKRKRTRSVGTIYSSEFFELPGKEGECSPGLLAHTWACSLCSLVTGVYSPDFLYLARKLRSSGTATPLADHYCSSGVHKDLPGSNCLVVFFSVEIYFIKPPSIINSAQTTGPTARDTDGHSSQFSSYGRASYLDHP